jgi:hypothetical protein
MLDNLTAPLNGGSLRIYDGTPPATADAALSGNALLAQLELNATAFEAATGGIATANAITADSSADATGTATFFRLLTSGAAVVLQGTVSATGGGGDLELGTTAITTGLTVSVSSLTIGI